ncbi:MAG: tRNA uracil 4-sulfurtransferase ThiI [Acholeplasmataceae bacterium]
MKRKILIRFGDLMLKGKNINFFIKRVRLHVQNKLSDLNVSFKFEHDRIYIAYEIEDEAVICKRLRQIPGIFSFSIVYLAKLEIEDIVKVSIDVLNQEIKKENVTFKIETKRANKEFPMTSQEISVKVAPMILTKIDKKVIVDVRHPEEVLHIELRKENTYIYLSSIKGMGGFPYGTGGKGLMMMSGGIDSPVASYLSMKQGIEVELIHFESSPLTPLESAQKVIDLAKGLSRFTKDGHIKLHIIEFAKIHESILKNVFDPYIITVMRRMMYRIAERYAKRHKILALLNGESVGQVASQTLHSMQVVEAVTKMPILRPLITYDKQDIINIAKDIDSYETSIKPFNDCCSIYVPRNPVTKPMEVYAKKYENTIDYESMIEEVLSCVMTFDLTENTDIDLTAYGFTVKEAFKHYNQKGTDSN